MGARYREMEIRTATPEMLVVKMYEGAIRFCHVARDAHGEGRLGDRGNAVSRALAIIGELQQCLNFDAGGEISTNLELLYIYISERLLDANMTGNLAAIEEVLRVLEPLREAWVEIAKNPPSESADSQPTAGPA